MAEKKPVTNDDVLSIYADSDCNRVIQSVLKGWANQLDEDTLTSCADDAIRKVIGYYDKDRPGAIKLTTALFREVHKVCKNAWDSLKRSRKRHDHAVIREMGRLKQGKDAIRLWTQTCDRSRVEAREEVDAILKQLAPGYRQIIQLYYFDNLPFVKISTILKVSPDKCRERLDSAVRAAKLLAECVA